MLITSKDINEVHISSIADKRYSLSLPVHTNTQIFNHYAVHMDSFRFQSISHGSERLCPPGSEILLITVKKLYPGVLKLIR